MTTPLTNFTSSVTTKRCCPVHSCAVQISPSDGGVLNVVQEGVNATNGHIVWVKKFNYVDSCRTLAMLGLSSVLGWRLHTGVFHFLMALTVLTRISEEVAIIGTYFVLVKGRKFGYKMYEDSSAQCMVPAALGSVEAAFSIFDDQPQYA